MHNINFLFVTLFGIGKIKKIPGSVASLATILFLFFLFHSLNFSPEIILISVIIIFFISLYAVNIFIKDLDNKDPKEIVIDEFIGQSIPIYLYEVGHNTEKLTNEALYFYIYIFILFRFFDIKKPFPINLFDDKSIKAISILKSLFSESLIVVFSILIILSSLLYWNFSVIKILLNLSFKVDFESEFKILYNNYL